MQSNNYTNTSTLAKPSPKPSSSHCPHPVNARPHPNPPSRPPPTLPKPKFILPQSSATNLALQRHPKSKSELNIATPSSSSSSSSCSADSSSSASSCCSSSATQQQQQQQQQQQPIKSSQETTAITDQRQTPTDYVSTSINPLRNKILENSSLVSSSQGYQSDTWESRSSRQSLDTTDSQPTVAAATAHRFRPKVGSKLAAESKLAKTTNLSQQQQQQHSCASSTTSTSSAQAIGSSCSDASMNGMASGSDDTDSSLPCQKSASKTKSPQRGGIELPIYYQTSGTTINANNEEVVASYAILIKNGTDSNGDSTKNILTSTTTNNNNSSYSDLYVL